MTYAVRGCRLPAKIKTIADLFGLIPILTTKGGKLKVAGVLRGRTNLINKRSKINYFGFHIANPSLKILRNFFLKRLVKNKNFIQNYLGKIYQ